MMHRLPLGDDDVLQTWLVAALLAAPQGSGSLACPSIADDRARLACYDELFGRPATSPTPAAVVASPAPEVLPPAAPVAATARPPAAAPAAAAGTAVAAADPAADFGLSLEQREARARQADAAAAPTEIQARIITVEPSPSGRFVLRLENGQTWAQVEPSQRQLFNPGESVRIRRAALGSFLASGPSSGTSVRVRRVE